MIHRRSLTLLLTATAVPLVALAATACGSSGNGRANAAPTQPTPALGAAASVRSASSGLGQILVNFQGRTLYLFQKDTGSTSTCTGACAAAWPPLRTTGQPTASSGANAALLATSPRTDGGSQVTYNGHPLYVFIKDSKPGDTTGQGVNAFGGSWSAVTPAGNPVSAQAPPTITPATMTPPTTTAPATIPPPTTPATTTPAPPTTTPPPPAPRTTNNGIPQGNGGDHDGDNNGGPSDGDGNL